MSKKPHDKSLPPRIDISDNDIFEAMKDIPGYLDITPGNIKELYSHAYRHAISRLASSIRADDIMTRQVVSVQRQTPLTDVALLMAEKGVSGVPVIDKDRKVAGVISEKDFLSRMGAKDTRSFMSVVSECLKGKGCVALSIRARKAEDIMSSPAVTVHKDTTLIQIKEIFTKKRINRVAVVDKNGFLIGIISREDIVMAPIFKGKT
jgi:CBS-domain-containing membrane protein